MPNFHVLVAESALYWQVSLSRLPMVSLLQFHMVSFIGILTVFAVKHCLHSDTLDTVDVEDSDS